MPIQILGLREFIDKQGRKNKTTRFFNKGWVFSKVEDVFSEAIVKKQLEIIPEAERYNLYFTVADCIKEREMGFQEAIPFDVDWVEPEEDTREGRHKAALDVKLALSSILGIGAEGIGCLWSGHGVQLFVFLEEPFVDKSFFNKYSTSYKKLCTQLSKKLTEAGIKHKSVDTSVFSSARLMRLPFTINRKEGSPDTDSFLVGPFHPAKVPLFLEAENIDKNHVLHDSVLKNYTKPDTKGVLAECEFIKWCKDNHNDVTEPQWYAMLSVVSRLDEGQKLCHEFSNKHRSYDEHATDTKIQQALEAAGPRTCEGVDFVWGKCSKCPHYQSNSIRSPIQIKSEGYIATEHTFFRTMQMGEDGKIKKGPLVYGDMVRAYIRDHKYKSQIVGNGRNGILHWIYTDDYWKRIHEGDIAHWVEKVTKGDVKTHEVFEFINKLGRSKPVPDDFFENSKVKYKQFSNCVMELKTGEVFAPSPEFGITHVVPHIYNKDFTCPKWDKFLEDVTNNDPDKIQLLNEFSGYILFSGSSWAQKALALVGDGANGKSVFMHILKEIVGAENCASIKIKNIGKEDSIAQLGGKLLNVCGEVSYDAFRDSSDFKELVEGGKFTGRLQYEVPRDVTIHTKFVMACNEVPKVFDQSFGFARRLIVIVFGKEFTPETEGYDPHIKDKLEKEIPGIINKLYKSYQELVGRGYFAEGEKIREEKELFLNASNIVTEFVYEYFEKGGGEDFIRSSTILQMADKYAHMTNSDPKVINSKRISAEFKRKFSMARPSLRKVEGKLYRGYFGIKVKPDIDIEVEEEF